MTTLELKFVMRPQVCDCCLYCGLEYLCRRGVAEQLGIIKGPTALWVKIGQEEEEPLSVIDDYRVRFRGRKVSLLCDTVAAIRKVAKSGRTRITVWYE